MSDSPLCLPAPRRVNGAAHLRNPQLGDWSLPSTWAMRYRKLRHQPMLFHNYRDVFGHRPWQVAPLDDMSPQLVVKKGRQMGFTELFLTKMLYISLLVRTRTIYTMPKWDKAKEIARTRLDPAGIAGHPDAFTGEALERLQGAWRGVMFKQVRPRAGGGFSEILVVGSYNEDLGESTAADQVLLDEYDRMRPGVISAFRECLSASRLHHLRLFSTPTFPRVGIDGQFAVSDKRRWVYTCPSCGHRQYLTRENIVQRSGPLSLIARLEAHDDTAKVSDGTFAIACTSCLRDLDRWHAKAEWVSESPGAEMRGYHASQLDCVWISADDVMRKLREYRPIEKWHNYVLAEAYRGDTGQLVEGFALALVAPELKFRNRQDLDLRLQSATVAVGIDWGKQNWAAAVAVSPDWPRPIILELRTWVDTNDPDDTVREALDFVRRWGAHVCVADMGYGQDRNPKLFKMAPCTFWGCLYPAPGSAGSTIEPMFQPIQRVITGSAVAPFPIVKVGRAPSIKARLIELYQGRWTLANLPELERYVDLFDGHCRNVAITAEELADGSMIEIAQTTGPDHLLHALNYAKVGLEWSIPRAVKVRDLEIPNPAAARREEDPLGISIMTPDDVADVWDVLI